MGWASLCAALVLLWQFLTVHYNYGDDWTALFYTGAYTTVPPALASEQVYTFPNSPGYDGQFYHYVAHDPALQNGFSRFVDNPRLRWRRILAPGLAYLLALGQADYIDATYILVDLAFVFLGAYWLSRYLRHYGRHPAWGLAFALAPAVLVSIDRATVDLTLAALCVGFALHGAVEPSWKVSPVLTLAPLARETGLCLVLAYALVSVWRRQWVGAVGSAVAAIPYLAWVWFVNQRTGPDQTTWLSRYPFSGLIGRTLHPVQYPLASRWLVKAAVLDYLALVGIWLGLILAVRLAWRRSFGLLEVAIGVFAAVVIGLAGKPDIWSEAYAFGRTTSPLLIWLALVGVSSRFWWNLLPLCLVLPRIVYQLWPQWRGIVHGLW